MRTAKCYSLATTLILRPEFEVCLVCQRRLSRSLIISRRAIITLTEVIRLRHWGIVAPMPLAPNMPSSTAAPPLMH